MLIKYDDYPLHQTAEPLSFISTSERNFYARYWYNGYDFDGDFYIGIAFAAYPHREVMDGAVSIVRKDGSQFSFHASRRLMGDRTELYAGPMRHEIVEPMRRMRIVVEENDTGFSCDLTFHANTVVHEEPADHVRQGVRTVAQMKRFSQFGRWEGHVTVNGERQEVSAASTYGTRDRSWGWRWTGEPDTGVARDQPEQFFWLWAPIHWEDRCTHWGQNEYADGARWKQFAQVFPTHPVHAGFDTLRQEEVREIICGPHRLSFIPGTRLLGTSEIDMIHPDGRTETFTLEPLLRYHMLGTGYNHPEWGHGFYKGEEAYALEHWNVDDLDVNAPRYLHIQHVVRATCGDKVGVGALEQYITGPHDRYGLTGFLDPYQG
jgi:hypothetical protein